MSEPANILLKNVVRPGCCTGCGACVALADASGADMHPSPTGPVPDFGGSVVSEAALRVCPAYRMSYPELYRSHYGGPPESWLLGRVVQVRTGHACDPRVRRLGASGGVITSVLRHLLETGKVDGVIAVRQGVPTPDQARAVICESRQEIEACSESVYIPVSVLDVLRKLEPGKRYAMTCLPDQSAALRALQQEGHAAARQVEYVLGPYTGTALYPSAIRSYLKGKGVKPDDAITSLKWRAGEWPGYLEITTASGNVFRSKKAYYNFLTPFFITRNSLQNMDFANEFCDLSVGDAWSPAFESKGGGYAVYTTRSKRMEDVIQEMMCAGVLIGEDIDPLRAAEMHGHMLDFKKRGGYIRNSMRRALGLAAPDFGMRPSPLPLSRRLVEVVISGLFIVCGTGPMRWLLTCVPERIIGPLFNRLRLSWKAVSKPTKRKGLEELTMLETDSSS